jgi:MDMPI C-terminal domain
MAAPSPLAFWARRQAHETAIHRYDAQCAAPGGPPPPPVAFDPALAADGVDELIMCFAPRRRYQPRDGGGGERSLTVRAQDAEGGWHVRLADGGTVATTVSPMDGRDDPAADCTLEGPAAGLYAFLWNRSDAAQAGLVITGRPETLAVWNASVRVRW